MLFSFEINDFIGEQNHNRNEILIFSFDLNTGFFNWRAQGRERIVKGIHLKNEDFLEK